jgi:hypothetical protein
MSMRSRIAIVVGALIIPLAGCKSVGQNLGESAEKSSKQLQEGMTNLASGIEKFGTNIDVTGVRTVFAAFQNELNKTNTLQSALDAANRELQLQMASTRPLYRINLVFTGPRDFDFDAHIEKTVNGKPFTASIWHFNQAEHPNDLSLYITPKLLTAGGASDKGQATRLVMTCASQFEQEIRVVIFEVIGTEEKVVYKTGGQFFPNKAAPVFDAFPIP